MTSVAQAKQDGKRAAENLLLSVWPAGEATTRVDPYYIAQQLDLKVYTAGLQDGVDGLIIKRAGESAEVYLSSKNGAKRMRFTCAHEIGHYVKRAQEDDLTEWEWVEVRDHLATTGRDPVEVYANTFAANLLMPEQSFRRFARSNEAPELALAFDVSLEAIKNRLKALGL